MLAVDKQVVAGTVFFNFAVYCSVVSAEHTVNFVSDVIRPHRKAHKKVSETLKELYGYLDS